MQNTLSNNTYKIGNIYIASANISIFFIRRINYYIFLKKKAKIYNFGSY